MSKGYFGVTAPSADEVASCAYEAQPDVDETDLVDEGAREALDTVTRFLDLRDAYCIDEIIHLLHPDCVIATTQATVEGEEAIRTLLLDWQMYRNLRQGWKPWRFISHDLDTDRVSPVTPARLVPNRPPPTSFSASAIYNALRKEQRPDDKGLEPVSTRYTLERTGWLARGYMRFDWRSFNMRETVVVVDGLIRLFSQQVID